MHLASFYGFSMFKMVLARRCMVLAPIRLVELAGAHAMMAWAKLPCVCELQVSCVICLIQDVNT